MSQSSADITESYLWQRIKTYPDFIPAIEGLRANAETVAGKIAEVLPEYTDHSITHMDALWGVTQQVFTHDEIDRFSPGEAFILACSFYIHDIGMGLAMTREGAAELEESPSFRSAYERAVQSEKLTKDAAWALALKIAARETHAQRAERFIDTKLPGLDRYLLESTELRNKWGPSIGQVAASHHWSMHEVEKQLGVRGRIPDPIGGDLDLGFVACALRTIDYAHINAARASSLDRLLRSTINPESLKHWNAQEHISGPLREEDYLVFATTRGIADVDAWWTFFEMANGLDREIAAVAEYLLGRTVSAGRFSLKGVKGIKTPQSFAAYVRTEGFEPVDIRFHPDSMERLVDLLGGRTLYGKDRFAAIRELLQNARDAIHLQGTTAKLIDYSGEPGSIRVLIETTPDGGMLSITDNGVGMSERVITNYLLGIAADYWHSSDFFSEYPGVMSAGFQPAGRFGIGFLSVFMIGHHVEIQTQKRGGSNLYLQLAGVGRRGSLITKEAGLRPGTSVRVAIERSVLGEYDHLDRIIRAKAPMVEIPITVIQQGISTQIVPKWWQKCTQEELLEFLSTQPAYSTSPIRLGEDSQVTAPVKPDYEFGFQPEYKWPSNQPEALTDNFRILAMPGSGRVLLCSKGFVIGAETHKGIVGLVDVGEAELNVARSEALSWNREAFRKQINEALRPHIAAALSGLSREQSIPSKYGFLVAVARTYGLEFLIETDLAWVSALGSQGECRLLSPADLLTRILESDELVITFGKYGDPWNSVRIVKACFPETAGSALILPVGSGHDASVGSYRVRDELVWDDLPSLFKVKDEFGLQRDTYDGSMLLRATLLMVASALNTSEAELRSRKWARLQETACLRIPLQPKNQSTL